MDRVLLSCLQQGIADQGHCWLEKEDSREHCDPRLKATSPGTQGTQAHLLSPEYCHTICFTLLWRNKSSSLRALFTVFLFTQTYVCAFIIEINYRKFCGKFWWQKVTITRKSTNYRRFSKAHNVKEDSANSMAGNKEAQTFHLSSMVFNVTIWREIQPQNR